MGKGLIRNFPKEFINAQQVHEEMLNNIKH